MSDKKEKKPFDLKKKLPGMLMTAAFFIFCGAIGWFLGAGAEEAVGESGGLSLLYLVGELLLLYLAFLLQIILHEGGHMIGGLMTGYRFVSFNIFGLVWMKGRDGRLHLGRMQIAGAGGQCLMAPPEYDEGRFPFTLYNMGGVILNAVTGVICLLLAIPAKNVPLLFPFLLEMGIIGLLSAAANGLPLPVDAIQNDGRNQLCIMKDENARRAFWVQMNVAAASAGGNRIKHMPEEWFRPFPEEAMDNPIVSAVAVMRAARLMDALDFDGAEKAIRALLAREKGVLDLYKMSLACDGATCELIAGRPAEMTDLLDTKQNRQLMKAMKDNPSIIRTRYAVALLKEKDADKAGKLLRDFAEAGKKYPHPQDVESEREILLAIQNAALNGGITA